MLTDTYKIPNTLYVDICGQCGPHVWARVQNHGALFSQIADCNINRATFHSEIHFLEKQRLPD